MAKKIKLFLIIGYVAFVLSLGVTYAVGAGQIRVLGTAFVSEIDINSDFLPVFPVIQENGEYFTSTNLPPELTHGEETWSDGLFTLEIVKPPSVANNGQETYTVSFQLINPTNYMWSAGLVSAEILSGPYSVALASMNPSMAAPGAMVNVRLAFRSKIDVNTVDKVRIRLTFYMLGKRRTLIIEMTMVPA